MKSIENKSIDMDCMLRNLRNGLELVVASQDRGVKTDSPVIRAISEILSHGLKKEDVGYWHIVREISHTNTRYSLARALKHIQDPKERGEFWIYYTLIEGSLESYLCLLVQDELCLCRHYRDVALLRTPAPATIFLSLVGALAHLYLSPLDSTSKAGLDLTLTSLEADSNLSTPSLDSGLGDIIRSQDDVSAVSSASSPLPDTAAVRLRKRVSWHETVTDSKDRPIWERRSWDWEEYTERRVAGAGPDEAAMEAVERGVPEGSEDPQLLYPEAVCPKEKDKPPPRKPARRRRWEGLTPGAEVDQLTQETEQLLQEEMCRISGLTRKDHRVFSLMDEEGEAVMCALSDSELCLVCLSGDRLNIQRIPYIRLEFIEVGPSEEEVRVEGRSLVVCGRGGEFCSQLDLAIRRHTHRHIDFIRLHFSHRIAQVKGVLYCFVAVTSQEPTLDEKEEHLMVALNGKSWFPATVALRGQTLGVDWDGTRPYNRLSLPMSSCQSCSRLSGGGRPYSFNLRFSTSRPIGHKSTSLLLAASSDLAVSHWMEVLLAAMAQSGPESVVETVTRSSSSSECGNSDVKMVRVGLGLSSAWLISPTSSASLLASISLATIVAILVSNRYIILELGCHEAEGSGSDWVLYFLSEEVKDVFLSTLFKIKPQFKDMVFPHNALSEDSIRCETVAEALSKKHIKLHEYMDTF